MFRIKTPKHPTLLALAVSSLIPAAPALSFEQGAAAADAAAAPAPAPGATTLDTVAVIGTRRHDIVDLDSAAPIDIVSAQVLESSGAKTLGAALAELIPAASYDPFNNANNAGARPLQFRGLGPDEVLILVNGKRRHFSAMLHGKASYGRGSQFVDLNNIPVSAVKRIEILRDGASAQYGSDAIAGVINVVLRDDDEGGQVIGRLGRYGSDRVGLDRTASGWAGFSLGEQGHLTFSAEAKRQDRNKNPNTDSRQQYFDGDPREQSIQRHFGAGGSADVDSLALALDAGYRLSDSAALYGFATYTDRTTQAPGVWRRPREDTTVRAIFPNGYAPELEAQSKDAAGALGLRWGDIDGAGVLDISVNHGRNVLDQDVHSSLNVSYGAASPTDFYLGRLTNEQTNFGVDYARNIAWSLSDYPLTFGAGALYRDESYQIEQGDYAGYAHGGQAILDGPNAGRPAAPGVQGFAAYQPQDEGVYTRDAHGAYASLEAQFGKFYLGLSGRSERYSDFGWASTGKLAARYDFSPAFALRGTVSNGFRAPSVGQIGFSNTTVTWVGGVQFDTRIFPVSHPAARALGASDLAPEESNSITLGTVIRPDERTSLTVDAYLIDIDDRITLTDNLTGSYVTNILVGAGYPTVSGASFLVNALSTRTWGIDVVGQRHFDFAERGRLDLSVSFTLNRSSVESIRDNPGALAGTGVVLIGRQTVNIIEESSPATKLLVGARYALGPWRFDASATRYGNFTHLESSASPEMHFGPQWVADLDIAYQLTPRLQVGLNVHNLFESYPDRNAALAARSGGLSGPYPATAPDGALGRFVSLAATFTF